MFDSVKESYGGEVIEVVIQVAKDHIEDAIKLANFIQTGLQIILGRQRRDYGLSEEFEPEHPIENLSEHARENAPVHNLGMESLCGLVGHRTRKTRHLEATSRSIILQGTKTLRDRFGESFRGFDQAAKRVKDIKLQWRRDQETIAGEKMSVK